MRFVRTTLTALVASLSLVPAGSAAAKPWHELEPVVVLSISAPQLDGPILLNGDRAWRVLYLSTFRGYGIGPAEPPGADRLGPPLDARYRFVQAGGDVQTLDQTLYPCAPDGRVWSYTAPGQDLVRSRTGSLVLSGWWHSAALATAFPKLQTACERSERSAAAAPVGPGTRTGLWLGLGALAALAALGVLERASRRRRQPARI